MVLSFNPIGLKNSLVEDCKNIKLSLEMILCFSIILMELSLDFTIFIIVLNEMFFIFMHFLMIKKNNNNLFWHRQISIFSIFLEGNLLPI